MKDQTVKQSILQLAQENQGDSSKLIKHTKSGLKLFVFEGVGLHTRAMSTLQFDKVCEDVELSWLIEELKKGEKGADSFSDLVKSKFDREFNALVAAGVISKATGRNYRSAVGRWSKFVEQQPLYQAHYAKDLPEVLPERIKLQPRAATRKQEPYALKSSELPSHLLVQIAALEDFWTTGGEKEREELEAQREELQMADIPCPEVKVKSKKAFIASRGYICQFFGYKAIKGIAPENWDLALLTKLSEIKSFNNFMLKRGNTHANALRLIEIAIAVAKQKYFAVARRSNWTDIDVIEDLRGLNRKFNQIYKSEHKANTQRKLPQKKVKHEELRQVCQEQSSECSNYKFKISGA
jgi:hypothetical protein